MRNSKKEDVIYDECIKEMFSRVGERYPNKELTDSPNWYQQRFWTNKQEEDFKYWMIDYLRKNLKLNKNTAIIRASMFLLQYGWTSNHKLPQIKSIVKR